MARKVKRDDFDEAMYSLAVELGLNWDSDDSAFYRRKEEGYHSPAHIWPRMRTINNNLNRLFDYLGLGIETFPEETKVVKLKKGKGKKNG